MTTRSASARAVFSASADAPRTSTCTRKPGANLAPSASQLSVTLFGQTTRLGQRAQPQQPRERLHGFSEAHVIGQDSAETVRREVGEKMKSLVLIGAQLGLQPGGQ